jgi:RimJ/RimL family protein N-acetyltransferase
MLPAGYPAELEDRLTLGDGTVLTIRPVVPDDAGELARAYAEADADTLYYRFFTAAPHIGAKQIHYLAGVDYDRRLALVAFDESGNGVGIARYEGLGDSPRAEVAVVVHPDWRRRGIATDLLRKLEAPARERGFEAFAAVYLPSNAAVAGLISNLGYERSGVVDGMVHAAKRLDVDR